MTNPKTKQLGNFLAFLYVSVFLLCLLFPATSWAAFTKQINYQGKLTDTVGDAVTDGNYDFEFKLYTALTGGSLVWTETRTGANQVTVADGLFSVMLGEVASLDAIDFDQPLYLSVNFNSDGEMSPRKVLGAVAAAFEANNSLTFGGLATTSFLRSDQSNTSATLANASTTNLTIATAAYLTGLGSTYLSVNQAGKIIATTTPVLTEADPVFTASFAFGIASSTNWDTAFNWGNHASAGYLAASSFNGLFDTRLEATISLPYLSTLAGLSTIGSSTGQTTILGKTILTNASTTNLTASGFLVVSGQTTLGNASTTNQTLSGFLNVSGKSTLANASSTFLTVSSDLNVSGKSTLGIASTTALSTSGSLTVTGKSILANASSTFLTVSSDLNVSGKSTLANASTTNLTISGTGYLSSLGSTYLAVNQAGRIIATTTPVLTEADPVWTSEKASYVPYTGATTGVNLGTNTLTLTGKFSGALASTTNLSASQSIDAGANYGYKQGNVLVVYASSTRHTTLIGLDAGRLLVAGGSGAYNIALGNEALYSATSSNYNHAIGYQTLYKNTSGSDNIGIGFQALYENTGGTGNLALGVNVMTDNTTGNYNIALGNRSLYYNTTGYGNTAVGYQAGEGDNTANQRSVTDTNVLFLGYQASRNTATASLNNATAIGPFAKVGISNALILGGTGASAVKVGIGTSTPTGTLHIVTAGNSIAPSTAADELVLSGSTPGLSFLSTGNSTIAFGDDGSNVAGVIQYTHSGTEMVFNVENVQRLGMSPTEAVFNESTTDTDFRVESDNNAYMLFVDAGTDRVGIGAAPAYDFDVTGYGRFTREVIIQERLGVGTSTAPTYALDVVGLNGDNVARFRSPSLGTSCSFVAGGIIQCTSDSRLKKNIESLDQNLDKILALEPVTYNWLKEGDDRPKSMGFIAQEMEQIFPALVTTNDDGYKGISMIGLIPAVVGAIQEQQTQIQALAVSSGQVLASVGQSLVGQVLEKIEAVVGVFERVKTKWLEVEEGLTIRDRVTGDYYCLYFENGVQKSLPGRCDDVLLSPILPVVNPPAPVATLESTSAEPEPTEELLPAVEGETDTIEPLDESLVVEESVPASEAVTTPVEVEVIEAVSAPTEPAEAPTLPPPDLSVTPAEGS